MGLNLPDVETALGTLNTTIGATNTLLTAQAARYGMLDTDKLMFLTKTFDGTAGSAATHDVTVQGALTSDAVFGQVKTKNATVDQSHLDGISITAADTVTINWDGAVDPNAVVMEILVVRSPNPYLTVSRALAYTGAGSTTTDASHPGLVAADVVLAMVHTEGTATPYEVCTEMGYQAANRASFIHAALDDSSMVGFFAAAKQSAGTKMIAQSSAITGGAGVTTTAITMTGVTTAHKVFVSLRTDSTATGFLALIQGVAGTTNTVTITHGNHDPVGAVVDIIAFDPS